MNIMTVKYESELQIIALTKLLSAVYETPVRPRGRHSDRKRYWALGGGSGARTIYLGGWRKE